MHTYLFVGVEFLELTLALKIFVAYLTCNEERNGMVKAFKLETHIRESKVSCQFGTYFSLER